MAHIKELNLRRLKRLRNECDWNIENQRFILLRELLVLFDEWFGRRPNLLDFFRHDEMDWLISKAIENWTEPGFGKDKLQKFIYFIVITGYEDPCKWDWNLPSPLLRTTPVHLAHRHNCSFLKDKLFHIYKYYVNYYDESGLTHFEIACKWGCYTAVAEFLFYRQDPNDCFALHLALEGGHAEVARLLLRHGADPNLTTKTDGSTPLHVICQSVFRNNQDLVQFFIETSEGELHREVQIDARDKRGKTPLHLAFERRHYRTVEVLLRRGANPNLACYDGMTPLHLVCGRIFGPARPLIELIERYPLRLDARDKWGKTPLHLAIESGNRNMVDFLLRRGANPNAANKRGATPTHLACGRIDAEVLKLFFEVNDDIRKVVRVDARDNDGLTPLLWAVLKQVPDAIDVILNRGADLSSFVFPTLDRFDDGLRLRKPPICPGRIHNGTKLTLASGLVAVVRRLEERGYELDRGDALTIMRLFAKYELSRQEDCSWCCEEECSVKMITIKPNLSLYDLIQLPPKQAGKLITYKDCMDFERSCQLGGMPDGFRAKCYAQLCEMISRKFFLDWALDPLVELLHYRLPIECCEMIADELKNVDLMNICFAAEPLRARSMEH